MPVPVFDTRSPEKCHLVMSMGVYNPDRMAYLDDVRLGQLLVAFLSVAKTTPDCFVHFIYTGVDNGYLANAARIFSSVGSCEFDPVFVSQGDVKEALSGTKMNNIGTHSMVRLALPQLFPDMEDCIWVDCDVVVFDDLNKMLKESREAIRGNRFMFAGAPEDPHDSHGKGIVNAGMLYMNLGRMRAPLVKERVISLCNRAVDAPGAAITVNMIDQDVVNAIGVARIRRRWNITLHNFGSRDKLPEDIGCLHFTGEKKYAWSPYSETWQYSFLRKLTDDLLDVIPDLRDGLVAVGTSSMDNEKRLPHVAGNADVGLNEPQPVIDRVSPDRIDVAYGAVGDPLFDMGLPVSMHSVAWRCSLPVSFHVAYVPGMVSDRSLDGFMEFSSRLEEGLGCSVELSAVPGWQADLMRTYGEAYGGGRWSGHLVSAFLHEAFKAVDLCVKLDVDTLCLGDMAWLVKYCSDRGLGVDRHVFGCRSVWRDSFCAEFNFGVAPSSFKMLRESHIREIAESAMKYGGRVLSDELYTVAFMCGDIRCGMYPQQWNMVGRVRQNLLSRDVMWYQKFDVFYGKKYRVDGYEPVLTQGDYRRSAKLYHYSLSKPWHDDGGGGWKSDPDHQMWDAEWAMVRAEYMGGVS